MRQPDMDYDIGLSIHWSSSVWDIHKKTNRIFSYNSWRCGDRRRTLAANAPMPGSHKWGNDHEMNSLRPLPVLLCSSQPKKGKQSTVYVPWLRNCKTKKELIRHMIHDLRHCNMCLVDPLAVVSSSAFQKNVWRKTLTRIFLKTLKEYSVWEGNV